MPILTSHYQPPLLFKNGHFSTIYSAKFRRAPHPSMVRERLLLKDGDFMDIDRTPSKNPSQRAVILLHGLEGHAHRTYMRGQAALFSKNNWDVYGVNFRGCSGEPNKSFESYNAGKTDDLEQVVDHILEKDLYKEVALVGFSLGGNLLLKYLGERDDVPKEISKGVAISAPLNLKGSLEALSQWYNIIYRTSFLIDLRKKYQLKMEDFPDRMSKEDLKKITSLKAFDDIYTAPAHGFKDAEDYYKKNSSLQFLPNIRQPIFILNAKNDSFLSENCYPFSLAENAKNIYLETPNYGGHVGFHQTDAIYYSEVRATDFLNTK